MASTGAIGGVLVRAVDIVLVLADGVWEADEGEIDL